MHPPDRASTCLPPPPRAHHKAQLRQCRSIHCARLQQNARGSIDEERGAGCGAGFEMGSQGHGRPCRSGCPSLLAPLALAHASQASALAVRLVFKKVAKAAAWRSSVTTGLKNRPSAIPSAISLLAPALESGKWVTAWPIPPPRIATLFRLRRLHWLPVQD
jgi:hypothetical protein